MENEKQYPNTTPLPDSEIERLREVVLKWVDAKKNVVNKDKAKSKKSIEESKKKQMEEIEKVTDKKPAQKLQEPKKSSPANVSKPVVAKKIEKKVEKQESPKRIKALKPKKENISKGKKIIFSLITIIILVIIFFGAKLYLFNSLKTPIDKYVYGFIPYPVAIIDYQILFYADYQDQLNSLLNFYDSEKNNNPSIILPSIQETQGHIFNRMVEKIIVEKAARNYNVIITDKELEEQVQALSDEIGSQQALENQLQNLYGWGIEEFQNEILKPLLLKNKVAFAIVLDDRLNQEAREKTEKLLGQVRENPETFAEIARQESEDITAVRGGDLGYFGPGQMVKEFEKVAFALEVGQISEIVKTQFGYHIIKIDEKLYGESEEVTQVKASHILIRGQNIDDYINEVKQNTKIIQFIDA